MKFLSFVEVWEKILDCTQFQEGFLIQTWVEEIGDSIVVASVV
jgi:hypothetical protein